MSEKAPQPETKLVTRTNGDIHPMEVSGRTIDHKGETYHVLTSTEKVYNHETGEHEDRLIEKSIHESLLSPEHQAKLQQTVEDLGEEALELSGVDEPIAPEVASLWSRETAEIPQVGAPTREQPRRYEEDDVVTTKRLSIDGVTTTAVSSGWFKEQGVTYDIFAYNDVNGRRAEVTLAREAAAPRNLEAHYDAIERRLDEANRRAQADREAYPHAYEHNPNEDAKTPEEINQLKEQYAARQAAERINGVSQAPSGMIEVPKWGETPAAVEAQPVPETARDPRARIEELTASLSEKDRQSLRGYARAESDKRDAQQRGDGDASILFGQEMGQYDRSLSPAAKKVKDAYAHLFGQL